MGGWDSTLTQSTVVTPKVVKETLVLANQLIADFNKWLVVNLTPQIHVGRPLGSSAYYEVDSEDTVYGDIDLQIIARPFSPSYFQFTQVWNNRLHSYIKQYKPSYVECQESQPGHIIFNNNGKFVQVDLMWHDPTLEKWGIARSTPERGVKGLLHGNLFSTLGYFFDMSIQHAGVQYKTRNNLHVPFNLRKDVTVHTLSIDPTTFVLDIFHYLAKEQNITNPIIDPLLLEYPGERLDEIKIVTLVNSIKGLAKSIEANQMFKNITFLQDATIDQIKDSNDFLKAFWIKYESKAMKDINSEKRDKKETPEAILRAENDVKRILSGLEMVKKAVFDTAF